MEQSIQELAKGLSIGIIMDGNGRWPSAGACPAPRATKREPKSFRTSPAIATSWVWSR